MPRQTVHSEEIQDVMGNIPGWIIRWGISMIFIIFVIVVAITYFIKYPEVISAPVVLTTVNPPAELIVRSTGKIDRFLVGNDAAVQAGEDIAVLRNTADYEAVIGLENTLTKNGERWGSYLSNEFTEQSPHLGELQSHWLQFAKACKTYRQYLSTGAIARKQTLLRQQIEKTGQNLQSQKQQLSLLGKDREFELRNLRRDSTLYRAQAITEVEYDNSLRSALQKDISLINQQTVLINAESNMLSMENQLAELSAQYENEITQYHIQLSEARENLLAQINQWRERYVLTSPIDGTVAFAKYWSENQHIMTGERLATVIPGDSMQVIGKMYIPSAGFAKVTIGQQVNVKLNGFPYMEYGMLKGELVSLSPVPEREGYAAEVIFPQGLISSYQTSFRFIPQMDGVGEIITKNMRLIERFIQPIKAAMKNNVAK